MTGVEYLTEVEKMINELTDEEFLELFGDIYDDEVVYEETFNNDQIIKYDCYYGKKEFYDLQYSDLNNKSFYYEGLGGAA